MRHVLISVAAAAALFSTSAFAQGQTPAPAAPAKPAPAAAPAAAPAKPATPAAPAVKPVEPAKAPAAAPPAKPEEPSASGERVWHVGPQVGLQVLPLYKFGVDADFTKALSFGVGYGVFSYSMKSGDADMTYSASQFWLEGRWHPFAGAFFVGAALGQAKGGLKGDYKFKAGTGALSTDVNTELELTYTKTYLAPKIGWMGRWDSGFMLGTDFGWQLALGISSDFTVKGKNAQDEALVEQLKNTEDYKKQKDDVEKSGNTMGKTLGLEWDVIKVGWLF